MEGIKAGRPVVVRAGDEVTRYLFRSQRVTTEDFRISSGPEATHPSSFEVFQGRRILPDGSLSGKAALAVVNDAVSMAYSTDMGDFLISKSEGGLVAKTLTSYEEGSTYGQFRCHEADGVAGTVSLTGDSPAPPDVEASISLEGYAAAKPGGGGGGGGGETAAEPVDHSHFRLGEQYDASLKEIRVMMVSGSTQTGTSANLSSSAADYLTFAARAADVYERQLGLRYQMQELVLIASDSGQPDVECSPNQSGGSDDATAVRNWCNSYRPQATYGWGHVHAWTLVDGSAGGTIGWSNIGKYGSRLYGLSVNERAYHWEVLIHELGHNVGASHTQGGVMNATSSSSAQEDFFTENANYGGYTAASDIYSYMSQPGRAFLFGSADLRNPVEMPFGVDDAVSTAADTPVTFNPLGNDLTATPLFGRTNILSLVEVGQVFPKSAGTVTMSGDEITFTPTSGFTGNVWFTYTVGGDVGNGGKGWLHSADVVITVGGDTTNPGLSPVINLTDDYVRTDFSADIRINPLLNDEGKGRLWAGGVHALSDFMTPGTAGSYSDGAFHLESAVVVTGNGTIALEKAVVTRNGVSTQDNTGYLVYSPGVDEPAQVVIQYTVEDSDGNQAVGNIYLDDVGMLSVAADASDIVEREGRVATITFTRSGDTSASEWVDFRLLGQASLTGSGSDVAISGFDSFNGSTGFGRLTIPSGQTSASLKVSAMEDSVIEGPESLSLHVTGAQSLGVASDSRVVNLPVLEAGAIATSIHSQTFDGFATGTTMSAGWTNESTSPGVWTAHSGTTMSPGTGPTDDHTPGGSGIYLYREGTTATNQQADLTSPILDLSARGATALEFYYHMYGGTMGKMHVDVYSAGSWHLDVMPALIGQQQVATDSPWEKVRIDVSPYTTSDFQVRFRGITGTYGLSDMCIDDFKVGEAYIPPTQAPVINGHPRSLNVSSGQPAYLSVVAQAYPSPSYQWKKNGVAISGATRSVLHFASASTSDSGIYTCEVTSGSAVSSHGATLHVGDTTDSDADGMNDTWETSHFGSTGASDGSLDSDGDGSSDYFEYLHGSIPTDAASKGFQFAVGSSGGSAAARFAWQVAPGMVLGQDYLLSISTNLSTWSILPAEHYQLTETPVDGKRSLELEVTHDYGSRVFLRIAQP